MRIKKTFITGILTLSLFVALGQQRGDTFAAARSSKTANLVYVHASVNGFATSNGSGEVGLLVDVMEKFEEFVASKYGITINSTYVAARDNDFKLYLDEVRYSQGGVFGLSNTSIKEERRKFLSYSPAFLNNISVLISHRSFPTLANMNAIGTSFNSKNGYGVPSTTNYARMMEVKNENFSSMKVTSVNSSREILENIAKDSNGFGFSDIHYYLEYLNQGSPIKRHPVGDRAGDKFGIIMPLGSDWEPVITEFLNAGFLSSSEYRQMVIDHLGKGALRMLN